MIPGSRRGCWNGFRSPAEKGAHSVWRTFSDRSGPGDGCGGLPGGDGGCGIRERPSVGRSAAITSGPTCFRRRPWNWRSLRRTAPSDHAGTVGISDPPEMTMKQRFAARYQGIRVSFGYPACPIWRIRRSCSGDGAEAIGVRLTEGHDEPEASVSAMVFSSRGPLFQRVVICDARKMRNSHFACGRGERFACEGKVAAQLLPGHL